MTTFAAAECSRTPNGSGPPPSAVPASLTSSAPPPRSPLYEARLLNVELCTEIRELRETIANNSARTFEIAKWTKRVRRQTARAESYRARVKHLEDAISAWLVGDLDENGLAAALQQQETR